MRILYNIGELPPEVCGRNISRLEIKPYQSKLRLPPNYLRKRDRCAEQISPLLCWAHSTWFTETTRSLDELLGLLELESE